MTTGASPQDLGPLLLDALRALAASVSHPGMFLEALLERWTRHLTAQRGLALVGPAQEDPETFELLAAFGVADRDLKGAAAPAFSRTIIKRALTDGPLLIKDVLNDVELGEQESIRAGAIRSALALPMLIDGRPPVGVLYFDRRRDGGCFCESDLEQLVRLVGPLAELLHQAFENHASRRGRQGAHWPSAESPTSCVSRLPGLANLVETARKAAGSNLNILIIGESGTGKEELARWIHSLGPAPDAPFVPIDCSALSESLVEAELFGHECGAFTGAVQQRDGLFVSAGQGMVFLDEVADLPQAMQPKLLRALEERAVRPVGASHVLRIHARILAATHTPLHEWVEDNRFRRDLYFRLAQVVLHVPPLRDRHEDLPALVESALIGLGCPMTISPSAWNRMRAHTWPGNVRELQSVIRRLEVLVPADRAQVDADDVDQALAMGGALLAAVQERRDLSLDLPLSQAEDIFREVYFKRLLSRAEGRRNLAAELAGITRQGLYKALKKFGLS